MAETVIRTEAIRIQRNRASHGSCIKLGASLRDEGQRHPLALWRDGTLVSGERRVFAAMLVGIPTLKAVYVDTIEDAAERLLADNQDDYLALPPTWSEVCKLWQSLRIRDEPAAVKRAEAARRRGVELRRLTQKGERQPGRDPARTDDYVLGVICKPFGISVATAYRIESVWRAANGLTEATDEKRELARQVMAGFDSGDPIWPGYEQFRGKRFTPVSRLRAAAPAEPVAAARQRTAWERTLPTMEGLVAGLIELGPPNPDLTWEEVGPVRTRLAVLRRELEKMINKMKENNQS